MQINVWNVCLHLVFKLSAGMTDGFYTYSGKKKKFGILGTAGNGSESQQCVPR